MSNLQKAVYHAKYARRWAKSARGWRDLLDRGSVAASWELAHSLEIYNRDITLAGYYLRLANGAPIVDAPAVNMAVWDY